LVGGHVKAIANWLDGLSEGQLTAGKSKFRLYVTPPWRGNWAQALNKAATAADVAALTDAIKREHAKLKKPKGCDAFIRRFLNASEEERLAVVAHLTVQSDDADPIDPLRDCLKYAVAPAIVDVLCGSAIGLAKERADRLIRDGKPALLDADIFKRDFIAFVQKNNIPGMLSSLTTAPVQGQVEALLTTRPVFIRQLEIIEVTDDERVRAVSDFLRTSADKSTWAELGLVFEGSLSDWDDELVRRHGLISGEIADLHPDKLAAIRGRLAYRRCAQLQAPLDGRAVPGHFVHGCFNSLADIMRLGWHPNYQSLLGEHHG
jgi:hypothetical protein